MKIAASSSCNNSNIEFLLHAEDGSFPYLTEYLIRSYFNPSDDLVKNHLIVGIAVKDTCVAAEYKKKESRKLKRKRSGDDNNQDTNTCEESNQGNETKNTSKPTGYTFDSKSVWEQTRLMTGFRTMTLPTFDLVDDAQDFLEKELAARMRKSKKTPKKSTNKDKSSVPSVTSTRDTLSLNSPNGLQQITPVKYIEVALKLQCDSMITLYDQVHQDDGKNRTAAAADRTKVWLERCLKELESSSSQEKTEFWAALSCYDSDRNYANSTKYLMEKCNLFTGITIVGWHHIKARNERNELIHNLKKDFPSGTKFSVLAASNMQQILDAVKNGIGLIGSTLPVKLARSHKALALNIESPNSQSSRTLDSNGCIDLSDEQYCHDSSPIIPGCNSLSCKYSVSYLHHLIKANELLAQILLFGHNLHQLLLLFNKLSIMKGKQEVAEACAQIERQLKSK
jgi:tRNA-guanine family transglycosylase